MNLPTLDWSRLLPRGAVKCPKDGEHLHWEVFGGMRVSHQKSRGHVYQARCPACLRHFDVLTPKDK